MGLQRIAVHRRGFVTLLGAAPFIADAFASEACAEALGPADISIDIAPHALEIAPGRIVHTIAYNGTVPGPAFRMRDGQRVIVDVTNRSANDELVHWHGFNVAPDVDGVEAFGTPAIRAGGRRRYAFTAGPAGTRWYHTHAGADANGHGGLFTGQFGFAIVEPKSDLARYDQEVLLALHEWEPTVGQGRHDRGPGSPSLAQPVARSEHAASMPGMSMPNMHAMPAMLEAKYSAFTINGAMLGAGDPIRVTRGERVLFRILNASATLTHRLALARHAFDVVALDGNATARSVTVDAIELGPAERADAIVSMDEPGAWVLGSTQDAYRSLGLGIVVEYAGSRGGARWVAPSDAIPWDYTRFGTGQDTLSQRTISATASLRINQAAGAMNRWTINGASYPAGPPLRFARGKRYRIAFSNASDMEHPMHLHGHSFELTEVDGKPTSGVVKDTAVVRPGGSLKVDLVASNDGRFLLHCHNELHMMGGLAAEARFEPI